MGYDVVFDDPLLVVTDSEMEGLKVWKRGDATLQEVRDMLLELASIMEEAMEEKPQLTVLKGGQP